MRRLQLYEITDGDALDYYRLLNRAAIGELVVDHPERGPMPFAMVTDRAWEALPRIGYVADAIRPPFLAVSVK